MASPSHISPRLRPRPLMSCLWESLVFQLISLWYVFSEKVLTDVELSLASMLTFLEFIKLDCGMCQILTWLVRLMTRKFCLEKNYKLPMSLDLCTVSRLDENDLIYTS